MAEHGMLTDHTDLGMTPVRMVTHPIINQAHGYLTSVISCEMLALNQQGSPKKYWLLSMVVRSILIWIIFTVDC